ncbi:MAG: AAA family ATPase [Erysipelotrichia bacterium]|nr:AAA family ATPase [Erysipelotrichia bacterium]
MVDIDITNDYEIVDGTLETGDGQGNKDKGYTGDDMGKNHKASDHQGDGSEGTKGQTTGNSTGEGSGENPQQQDNLKSSTTDPKDLKVGDKFYGTIKTAVKDKNGKPFRTSVQGVFTVTDRNNEQITVETANKMEYKTSEKGITIENLTEALERKRKEQEKKKKEEEEKRKKEEAEAIRKAREFDFSKLSAEDKVRHTIKAGINNIWMVGPAGCGKSTIARNVAAELEMPYLCISCGIGTSAVEFVGYKYPNRESTKFSEYYQKPSVILIDEMTALDPAVAQVINAALANNEIETTTGLVQRHPDCIIIATSNTFGAGASRQYVANNQLDASTIDRFIGGIIEVDYSLDYEMQYDEEVVEYVYFLRDTCKQYDIRRIASTRMIQAGHRLKNAYMKDWREQLVINWSGPEKKILEQAKQEKERQKGKTGDTKKAITDWEVLSRNL